MANNVIKITKEEHAKLLQLYARAQDMPVIKMDSSQEDWATKAWNEVRNFMDMLAAKYGYDPEMYAINRDGEVVPRP